MSHYKPIRYAALVVEDEPLLLMDAMDLVEDAGLTAYGARNAAEAIDLMDRHPDIRILFTDIHMSGDMDGLMLAHAVRRRWPPIRIIVTSGVAKLTQADLPEDGLFFSKPYSAKSVTKTLNDMAASFTA